MKKVRRSQNHHILTLKGELFAAQITVFQSMRQISSNINVNCIKHTTGGRIGFPLILKTETYCVFACAIANLHRFNTKNITNEQII